MSAAVSSVDDEGPLLLIARRLAAPLLLLDGQVEATRLLPDRQLLHKLDVSESLSSSLSSFSSFSSSHSHPQ